MRRFVFRTASELKDHLENGPVQLGNGRDVSLAEACRIQELDPIIKRFGTWAVTEYGVECLSSYYAIAKTRLRETDWKDHMIHKTWVVAGDVCDALDFAKDHFYPRKPTPIVSRPEAPTTPGRPARPRRASVSTRVRFTVMKRDQYRCQLCGVGANAGVQLDIDHKLAVAKGGTNDIENLWVLCWACNNGKRTDQV